MKPRSQQKSMIYYCSMLGRDNRNGSLGFFHQMRFRFQIWVKFRRRQSIVHLFETIIALVVTPIDEDRAMVDAGAVLPPAFEADMCLGQGV